MTWPDDCEEASAPDCDTWDDPELGDGYEPIGECERCGCNVYANGYDENYCDQCSWWIEQA